MKWSLRERKCHEPHRAPDPERAPVIGASKPGLTGGFKDPKGGEKWVKNPHGPGWGWEDAKGDVWCPSGPGGKAHGGPQWDVQRLRSKARRSLRQCVPGR